MSVAGVPGATPPAAATVPPTTPGVAPATPPAVDPNAANAAKPITFNSQADLDNALAERLSRKEEATRRELAKSLGVEPDKLAERIAALTKLENDSLTEAEKKVAEARVLALKESEDKTRAELAPRIAAAQEAIIRADVIAQAQAAGFRHPEDVWARIKGSDKITIDADTFAVKGTDKVIEQVAKDRPDWIGNVGAPFRGSPPGGGGGPSTRRIELEALERTMLERRGRLTGGTRSRL